MADDRIAEWARMLAQTELRTFLRAGRRFLARPSRKRLRDVRLAAARLHSLRADFGELAPVKKRKRLQAVIEHAGAAREAHALRKILTNAMDPRERIHARLFLKDLRRRERQALRRVYRLLQRYAA